MQKKNNSHFTYRNINIQVFYNESRATHYFTFKHNDTEFEVDCGNYNYMQVIYNYIDNLLDVIKYFPQYHGVLKFTNNSTITLFYNHMPIKTYNYNLSEDNLQMLILEAEADLILCEGVINGKN